MDLFIDPLIHERLREWAKWCREGILPASFAVICRSVEREWLPPSGSVWVTASEALEASVRSAERKSVGKAWETEQAVVGLPDKPRAAVRLHYIVYKRLPIRQKLRILGVNENGYAELLHCATEILKKRLLTT